MQAALRCLSAGIDLLRRNRCLGRWLVCKSSRLETRETFGARRESSSLTSGAAPRQVGRGTTNKREGAVFSGDVNKGKSFWASVTRLKNIFLKHA